MNAQNALHVQPAPEVQIAHVAMEEEVSMDSANRVANFAIRLPQYVPEGMEYKKITGARRDNRESIEPSSFTLHYGSGQHHWMMIEQNTDVTAVGLTTYKQLESIQIEGKNVSIYQQVEDATGDFTHYYLAHDGVSFFVSTIGVAEEEMRKMVASLAAQ